MKKFLMMTVAGGVLITGAVAVTAQTRGVERGAPILAEELAPTEIRHRAKGHRADHRAGRRGDNRMGRRLLRLRDDYDADGDGRVTQAEIDETRTAQHATHDGDGDGALSLTEYEALWLEAMRERMVRRFQRHDRDGDGQVTADEYLDTTSSIVELRDRTGDGALDLDDVRRGPRERMRRERQREEGGREL
ncbi:MAG: hypothetical protein AAF899_00035 [Pseudomonadota bacterium]